MSSRVRHDSLGEESSQSGHCERIPCGLSFPRLQNGDEFANIDWNQESNETKKSIKDRLTEFLSSIPRRVWIIIITVFIVILFAIAVAIVVLVLLVLPHGNNNHNNQNIVNSTLSPIPSTASPPAYPQGYVISTISRYLDTGSNFTIVSPDYRSYQYRERLFAYTNQSINVIQSNSSQVTLPLTISETNCTYCQLMAIDDLCLNLNTSLNCTMDSLTYCCYGCPQTLNTSYCSIQGLRYDTPSRIVEYRISSDGQQLLLSTLSTTSALQVDRINKTGIIHSGPIIWSQTNYSNPFISTVTIDTDYGSKVDLIATYNTSTTYLNLDYNGTSASIFTSIKDDVIDLVTSFNDNHLLVAVVSKSQFSTVRINRSNGCISVLAGKKVAFSFEGEIQKSYWLNDRLMIYYVERTGINGVEFTFSWDDDEHCSQKLFID